MNVRLGMIRAHAPQLTEPVPPPRRWIRPCRVMTGA
jgi:hypothetical protein